MSISWRNSWVVSGVLLLLGGAVHATPINAINFNFGSTTRQFQAGVTTSTILSIDCFINSNQVPDATTAGEVMTISFLESGQVVSGPMPTTTFPIQNGRVTYGGSVLPTIDLTFFKAGINYRMRVTSGVLGVTADSPTFSVSSGTASKLLILAPGMTHVPGRDPATNTGFTGTPTPQDPGEQFLLTVMKTDNWFNIIQSAGPTVTLTSSDLVTLPAPQALTSGGFANLPVTISIARSVRTINVSDAGALADASIDIPTGGPEKETVFPFPSPFNPNTSASMTFRFQLNEATTARLIVKDQFGQDVWRTEYAGVKGPNNVAWDGRNEHGHVVAAGIYYVLLDVNGQITSKKRFGVSK